MRSGILLFLVTISALAAAPAAPRDPFESWWRDGKAELDGYRLHILRYGHPRTGRAVAVYVTEPFSRARHVKLDDPARAGRDAMGALKLNLVRDFQTGIYDYHTILSFFADDATFAPLKIAFSSSEWCGQVYEEMNARGGALDQRIASYFDGETGQRRLPIPPGGLEEDELFVKLRGLRGTPLLAPGSRRSSPFLASPFWRRLAHRPAEWGRATIERSRGAVPVAVPAGRFDCDVYLVHVSDGREARFDVERAYPHRIVRWSWLASRGVPPLGGVDGGELTGSVRLAYWRTHDPGDEKFLRDLGVAPGVH
jgi:hypothetical protein